MLRKTKLVLYGYTHFLQQMNKQGSFVLSSKEQKEGLLENTLQSRQATQTLESMGSDVFL